MGGMTRLLLLLWAGVTLTTALDLQKRIFNGSECRDDERLYYVKVLSNNVTHESLCGGSLIHEQWILTAAHCYKPGWTMEAVLRVHPDRTKKEEVPISDHKIHYEDEIKKLQPHDIMLLKLSQPSNITPIGLPDCRSTAIPKPDIDEVQIAGHGDTSKQPGAQGSDTLQCAKLKIQDTQTEMKTLTQKFFQTRKYQHLLFGFSSTQDICDGDSGVGVVFNNMIYGVHSFSGRTECSRSAGFMDVCKYSFWINSIINPGRARSNSN